MIHVQYTPLTQIQTWDRNPKDHDLGQLHQSMERWGYVQPVLLNEDSERLVAGHGRLEALAQMQAAGTDPPEGIQVAEDGEWLVPVIRGVSFQDQAEAEAYGIADNQLVILGGWDDGKLTEILTELASSEQGLAGTGYDDEDLDDLLSRLGSSPDLEPEVGDLETPEGADDLPTEVEALTQAGDVVQVGRHTLHCADCLEMMEALPDCSVDAIVTDPPYGIGFMQKGWDCSVPGSAFADQAYRVLKPGGHIVAFAATRTIHRLTVALEDAGLEIRDQISWLTWQGFPKSLDAGKALDAHFGAEREDRKVQDAGVSGSLSGPRINVLDPGSPATPEAQQWQGWGTALKPCAEPCILARKPLEGTVAENLLKWGVGCLNVDGCRYPYGDPAWPGPQEKPGGWGGGGSALHDGGLSRDGGKARPTLGRWPANVYHTPKASRSEREQGCDDLATFTGAQAVERQADTAGLNSPRAGAGRTASEVHNNHPTVKPVRLMQWLVRLVTPPGCTVLEPFAGSGTTLLACELEDRDCLAVELEPAYCDIVRARLTSWQAQTDHP